jgi:hypothetical protein
MKIGARALVVGALVGGLVTPAIAQRGSWRRVADLSAARVGPAVAALPGGGALVAGGSGLATAEVYNPATGRFSPTGSMSAGRSYATATVLFDGTVLIAGGAGPGGALNTAEIYDPGSGRFTPVAGRMSVARERHTATLLPNGDVLMVGGFSGRNASVALAEIYDADRGVFRVTGSMSISRGAHAAAYVPAGYVLVVGGLHTVAGQLVEQSSAELYGLATGGFSPAGLMSADRERPTVTYMSALGQAVVIGGQSGGGRGGTTNAQSCEIYDVGRRTFVSGPSLNIGRAGHQTVALADGRLLVIGGYSDALGRATETSELYSAGGGFTAGASLAQARQEFGAVRLRSGQVLAVGGRGSGGAALRSAELFTP